MALGDKKSPDRPAQFGRVHRKGTHVVLSHASRPKLGFFWVSVEDWHACVALSGQSAEEENIQREGPGVWVGWTRTGKRRSKKIGSRRLGGEIRPED